MTRVNFNIKQPVTFEKLYGIAQGVPQSRLIGSLTKIYFQICLILSLRFYAVIFQSQLMKLWYFSSSLKLLFKYESACENGEDSG